MKRVLLSLCFLIVILSSKAQLSVVFNEIYPDPNISKGRDEFVELFNTTTMDVELDCYVLVSYFNDGTNRGVYVYNFPANSTIKGLSHYVISSDFPITYKGDNVWNPNSATNHIDWDASTSGAYLMKYTLSGNTWGQGVPITSGLDIMYITNGPDASVNLLLYKLGSGNTATLVNGFFGNGNGTLPSAVTGLPGLSIPADNYCSSSEKTLNFAGITYNNVEVVNVGSAAGQDNEYKRSKDGICGSWIKESDQRYMTPGTRNSLEPPISISNDIKVSYSAQCFTDVNNTNNPSKTAWSITVTISNSTLLPAVYRTFIDNGDGIRGAEDAEGPFGTIADNEPNLVPKFDAPINRNIFIQITTASGCIQYLQLLEQACTVTPVTFSNFQAQRNKQAVALKWETASEQNNRGFNVQRNTRGVWETVAFVFSQADGGNSDELLTYEYKDANSEKGVSQYRIQQVDLDGKASYSVIRSVKGLEQAGTRTVVYPNPSADGKVNVVFEDLGAKAVTVSDVSGRVVRQYRYVLNNVQLEGLESGMYSIQITDLSSAVSSTEKVIIKKR